MELELLGERAAPAIAQAIGVDRVGEITTALDIECRAALLRVVELVRNPRMNTEPGK